MRNVKSILNRFSQVSFALLALAVFVPITHATPSVGAAVKNAQGQVIGTVSAPLNSEAKLTPSVVIQLTSGGKEVAPVQSLKAMGNDLVLAEHATAPNESEEALATIFEIRSMTMSLLMQSTDDAVLLRDISNLSYSLDGDTLHLRGSVDTTDQLQDLLTTTSELCDYQIAPRIAIREGLQG